MDKKALIGDKHQRCSRPSCSCIDMRRQLHHARHPEESLRRGVHAHTSSIIGNGDVDEGRLLRRISCMYHISHKCLAAPCASTLDHQIVSHKVSAREVACQGPDNETQLQCLAKCLLQQTVGNGNAAYGWECLTAALLENCSFPSLGTWSSRQV